MNNKKRLLIFIFSISIFGCCAQDKIDFRAGRLQLKIDENGQLRSLTDVIAKRDYLHSKKPSYLLMLKRYSENALKAPVGMRMLNRSGDSFTVKLIYDEETSLQIEITKKDGWFRFEVGGATGIDDIDMIRWGPFYTNIVGTVGEFFGVLHSDESTIGMMSLEPNTDGLSFTDGKIYFGANSSNCAFWMPYPQKGSYVLLDAMDHTRSRKFKPFRSSTPVKGFTIIGSAVALYCAEKGRELDQIEEIVLNEGLPHPVKNGEWIKRSMKLKAPSIWTSYNQNTATSVMELCEKMKGSDITPFLKMFGNWGHFQLDSNLYPGGDDAIRRISEECTKNGIGFTMYTLTNFLKPKGQNFKSTKGALPEPFITPVIDKRFETYDITSELVRSVNEKETKILIKEDSTLNRFFSKNGNSKQQQVLLKIGNELIYFKEKTINGDHIIFSGCIRGYLMSAVNSHKKGDKMEFLYHAGYESLFPGTLDMNKDVAMNIGNRAKELGFTRVLFDGIEGCLATGHGYFAKNQSMKTVYDINKDREMDYSASRISNYTWYMMGPISWGEHRHPNFRGTMLDYRINRQLQLQRSHTPHKLGQYYMSDASPGDINWLMGLTVGWNAGVDFSLNMDSFEKRPDKDEIIDIIRKWEDVRKSDKVTDKQKLLLRQIDCSFDIKSKKNGTYELVLKKRWHHEGVEILNPSVIILKNKTGGAKAVDCGIDISWTHSPLIFQKVAISNDIPLFNGNENDWSVAVPGDGSFQRNNKRQFNFVLRVPEDAKTGIKNPVFSVDGKQFFMVPVTLQPGQYMATPLNIPMAFIYNKNHEVLFEVPIRYSNNLPILGTKTEFRISCKLEALNPSDAPIALLNIFHSEIIKK